MRLIAAAAVIAMCLIGPAAAADFNARELLKEFSLDQVLPLPIRRSVTEIAVFNTETGRVRWLKVLMGLEPEPTAARLSTFFDRPVDADALRVVHAGSDGLLCTCQQLLGPDEYLVSEDPIRDASGRYVSINDEAYKAITELIDYPLTSTDLVNVMLSELAYVNNDDAVRGFLTARGFEVLLTHGFLNAERRSLSLTLPIIVAHHTPTRAGYVAIRGTAEVTDLQTSLQAALVPWAQNAGLVHKGFYDAAVMTAGLVQSALRELATRDPAMPLFATGHSLGAAVATILTLRVGQDFPTLRAVGFAPPPLGNNAFLDAVRERTPHITSFFVPNEEIRGLGDLSRISELRWLGTEKLLDDMGATANRYHYVINYLKGVLAASGGDVKAYEQSLPICVLYKTPCFTGWREHVIPQCVLDKPDCVKNRWSEMQRWLSADNDDPAPSARQTLATLKMRVLRGNPPDHLRPLIYAEMARVAGAAGAPQEAMGYLTAAERITGTRPLYATIRTRLAEKP